ncbi:lyase family protein [Glycomyces xiaoerkulensis]|uniref:lyase family protein n=1 Tax=Glycomyces xiaoerkulensis TaxID=2038139 RepID=UPI0018E4D71D|nr:lyase family protein [Glycomyces xiaoerkulensis]
MNDRHDTGRIREPVLPGLRDILYGATADEAIDDELGYMTAVDRAHLLMLASTGIVAHEDVVPLLGAIEALEADDFGPLRGRHAPRGLYLLYEHHLAAMVGEETAGRIHTGRSRNDLKATVCQLRLRDAHCRLLSELLRTEAIALSAARRHRDAVMSGFTHFQPSVPITFGFYLAGFAAALGRETDRLLAEGAHLERSPLGAGAMAGTDLAIDQGTTAGLLGFSSQFPVALDAVASRDSVTAVLSTAASIGIASSRAAMDLQMWTTAEPALLELPDHLVGSSSAMPQKRNAYLLEQLRGRSSQTVGALTAALLAAKSAPFTNSIEVGTEAVEQAWPAFDSTVEVLRLLRAHFTWARPRLRETEDHAARHHTAATAAANRLVSLGHPFRRAHEAIGRLISAAEEHRTVEPDSAVDEDARRILEEMDVRATLEASAYGGGPAPDAFDKVRFRLQEDLRRRCEQAERHLRKAASWRHDLNDAVRSYLAAAPAKEVKHGDQPDRS